MPKKSRILEKRSVIWGIIVILFCTIFFATPVKSVEWTPYVPNLSNHFVNPRPAAMGEAFTAVANDQNALYYNPAGLARLGAWKLDYLELLAPMVGFSQYDLKIMSIIMANQQQLLGFSSMMKDEDSFYNFREFMVSIKQNPIYFRQALNPYFIGNFANNGIGFGIYENFEFTSSFHENNTLARIETVIETDIRFGYARNFLSNKFSLGVALAYRVRGNANIGLQISDIENYSNTKNIKQLQDLLASKLETGQAAVIDGGLLFTPIELWQPTFGLSVLNIGDARFLHIAPLAKYSKVLPDNIPQSVNVGLAVTPTIADLRKLFTRFSFDLRDINLPTPAAQKFRFGFETGFDRLFTIQLGLSNGGMSFGAEAKLFVVTLRYANYMVEKGYSYNQKPERRHLVNVKLLI